MGTNKIYPKTIYEICSSLGAVLSSEAYIHGLPSEYIVSGSLPKDFNELSAIFRGSFTEEQFKTFDGFYRSQKGVKYTAEDSCVFFCDYVRNALPLGFMTRGYFSHRFFELDEDERKELLTPNNIVQVYRLCANEGANDLADKKKFAQRFAVYMADPDAPHTALHPELVRIGGRAEHEIRVISFRRPSGEICPVAAIVKLSPCGKKPSFNVPVTACVDIRTGIIVSPALTHNLRAFDNHLDIGADIKGAQLPCWNKVLDTVIRIHSENSVSDHVAWDFLITADERVLLKSAALLPSVIPFQMPGQPGLKKIYTEFYDEIAKAKAAKVNIDGIEYKRSLPAAAKKPVVKQAVKQAAAVKPVLSSENIGFIGRAAGVSPSEAAKLLRDAAALGVSSAGYIANYAWRMSSDELRRLGLSLQEQSEKTRFALDYLGIDEKTFLRRGYKHISKAKIVRHAQSTRRSNDKIIEKRTLAAEALGISTSEFSRMLTELNSEYKTDFKSTFAYKYNIFSDGAVNKAVIAFMCDYSAAVEDLREKLYICDLIAGNSANAQNTDAVSLLRDIECGMAELSARCAPLLSEARIDEIVNIGSKVLPAIADDRAFARSITADVEITEAVLYFNDFEYFCFGFSDKSLEERRSFVSGRQRQLWLNRLNSSRAADILDVKSDAYLHLKKFYGREILIVNSAADAEAFIRFCEGKDKVVLKNDAESLGRGVELLDLSTDSLENIFDKQLAERKSFIVEDLVINHPQMAVFNKSSVNTVRAIVYRENGEAKFFNALLRVGRNGTFVDNAGAGGLIAGIDYDTGIVSTEGVIEPGIRFDTHPDSGTVFKGYAIPDWEQAVELAKTAIEYVPGLNFVGWDLAYTADGKWVIIEGNSTPQFIGSQVTTGVGIYDKTADVVRRVLSAGLPSLDYIPTVGNEPVDKARLRIHNRSLRLSGDDNAAVRRVLEASSLSPISIDRPNKNLRSAAAWLKLNYDSPVINSVCGILETKEYVRSVLGESWVRPTVKRGISSENFSTEGLNIGDVLRSNTNRHLSITLTDELVNSSEKLSEMLAAWENPTESDYYYTLGKGCKDVHSEIIAEKAPESSETRLICICINGRADYVCVPANMRRDATYSWYRIGGQSIRLYKQGANNYFDNLELCAHIARAANRLTKDMPLAVVCFSVTAQREYVDYIELYPSEDFIHSIPEGIRDTAAQIIRLV